MFQQFEKLKLIAVAVVVGVIVAHIKVLVPMMMRVCAGVNSKPRRRVGGSGNSTAIREIGFYKDRHVGPFLEELMSEAKRLRVNHEHMCKWRRLVI